MTTIMPLFAVVVLSVLSVANGQIVGGSCNVTFSNNAFCIGRDPFIARVNGECIPSTGSEGCYFILNCACTNEQGFNGLQFRGWENDQCSGNNVAIHSLPVDSCTGDNNACDPPNSPFIGYTYLLTSEHMKCCPQCYNNSKAKENF